MGEHQVEVPEESFRPQAQGAQIIPGQRAHVQNEDVKRSILRRYSGESDSNLLLIRVKLLQPRVQPVRAQVDWCDARC